MDILRMRKVKRFLILPGEESIQVLCLWIKNAAHTKASLNQKSSFKSDSTVVMHNALVYYKYIL